MSNKQHEDGSMSNDNTSNDDMTISLRFFASVRESLGTSEEALILSAHASLATVGDLRVFLAARGGVWAAALSDTRVLRTALNQVMCSADAALFDGCEVAFFPPVTGG
jgi:molybdopterin synthase sulfur carrier subunit